MATWLRRVIESRIAEGRMILAVGTKAFSERSRELYGGARTQFYEGKATNLDLADHLLSRLKVHGWDEASDPEETPLDAEQFGQVLRAHVEKVRPRMEVDIVIDAACTARVLAGMKRVRIRPDATFQRDEAEGLWHHEVETHALTAQNGAAQVEAPFLSSGGPHTTRTQEGLAVFSELYHRVLTVHRLERLAVRVKLVDMAEEGASFLDLYRFLVARGSPPRDAYFDAQRICRGGRVEGGAPFTKDACYLSGLLHVYSFLNAFVRGGFRDETELLVCGRIDLEDITALVQLRALGVLTRPRHRPRWLRRWDTLLPYFAFSSFMKWIDLSPVEEHYREVIALSEQAAPRPRAPARRHVRLARRRGAPLSTLRVVGGFALGRPDGAVQPVEDGDGDVEVPPLHQAGIVVAGVELAEAGDQGEAADEALAGQVVGEVEPLVGQEEEHRRGQVEAGRIVAEGQPDAERHGRVDQGDEQHRVGRHEDEPPLAPAAHGHVVVGVDDVVGQLVPLVEEAEARGAAVQHRFVDPPLEAEGEEEGGRHGEPLEEPGRPEAGEGPDHQPEAHHGGGSQVQDRAVPGRDRRHEVGAPALADRPASRGRGEVRAHALSLRSVNVER